MDFTSLTKKELQQLCKNYGLKRYSTLTKDGLIEMLKVNERNNSKTNSNSSVDKLQLFINKISIKYNIPQNELEELYDNPTLEEEKQLVENEEEKVDVRFKEIIDNNLYFNKTKYSTGYRDKSSLSYLVEDKLINQSECIKMGIALEKVLLETITKYGNNIKNIKNKNKKGEKEKDHLFIDEENKIIYYAELKANLNLDTEKSKSTTLKCCNIKKELEQKYENYNVKMSLVGLRYYSKNEIPRTITNKYVDVKDNLYGINEYLQLLGLETLHFTTENNYKYFINYVYKNMIKK